MVTFWDRHRRLRGDLESRHRQKPDTAPVAPDPIRGPAFPTRTARQGSGTPNQVRGDEPTGLAIPDVMQKSKVLHQRRGKSSRSAEATIADIHQPVHLGAMNVSKAVGVIVVTVVLATWAYIALTGEPRLPINIANGSYSNRCCGTVIFTNGVMTVADQRVSYVVEEDKVGPYVLPTAYVGASKGGVMVRSGSSALKLRLDDSVHPQQVELIDDAPGGKAYLFVRGNGS